MPSQRPCAGFWPSMPWPSQRRRTRWPTASRCGVRFVVTCEWDRSSLLRLILLLFLVYVFLFWLTDWVLWFQKMDWTLASIREYYRGDPTAEFGRPARPLGALAEVAHFHLFAMGILVMT